MDTGEQATCIARAIGPRRSSRVCLSLYSLQAYPAYSSHPCAWRSGEQNDVLLPAWTKPGPARAESLRQILEISACGEQNSATPDVFNPADLLSPRERGRASESPIPGNRVRSSLPCTERSRGSRERMPIRAATAGPSTILSHRSLLPESVLPSGEVSGGRPVGT